jgi:hypothetical protein
VRRTAIGIGAYVGAKQKQNVLDYDDLLLYWARMMVEGTVAQDVASRFDHVLVDEYQDTNHLQASILLALKPNGRGLTVVGDDAQSIYSFRVATVRNILDFPGDFSPKAEIIALERNYRSTQPVLAAENAVIDLASEGFTKNLWSDRASAERPYLVNVADDTAQAGYVVERVLENREAGITLKSQAVRFRASHDSASLEVELTRRNIPFVKFGGLKFLEAARTCWQCCAGRRTSAISSPDFAWPSSCRHRARFGGSSARPGGRMHQSNRRSQRIQTSSGDGRALAGIRRDDWHAAPECDGLAGRARSRLSLVSAASRTHSRGRSASRGGLDPTHTDCFELSEPGAFSDRADARSARRNE